MSGWLDKRGGLEATKVRLLQLLKYWETECQRYAQFRSQRWKRRWCILSNHVLRYYKSDAVSGFVCHCQQSHAGVCVCVLQDSSPAGTIFAEDIVDVTPDYEESKKDSKVIEVQFID